MDTGKTMKLTRNALQCLGCGDVIESKYRHDYVTCSCGAWSVDGGLDYTRRAWREDPFVPCVDLCEWEEINEDD